MNFEFHNPIHFIYGTDALSHLGDIFEGRRVLIVYGGSSARHNGAWDKMTKALDGRVLSISEYGSQTKCTLAGIEEGIRLAKEKEIDGIIGVGGASAIDTAKAIAFGIQSGDIRDFVEGRKEGGSHVLNVTIPTYPSTGTEADGVCDIMEYKDGMGAELFGAWPDYSLLDPSLTFTLDRKNTAYSVLVTFIQNCMSYIGNDNRMTRRFAGETLKLLIESYLKVLSDPEDEDARGTIMLASSWGTMGISGAGITSSCLWSLFSLGYLSRVIYRVSYRESLAVSFPVWLEGLATYHFKEIRPLFTEIFGISGKLDDETFLTEGIRYWRNLMTLGRIPQTLASYGKAPGKEAVIKELAKEDYGDFTEDEMTAMLAKCYE